jgi:hypothetical protein
MRAHYTPKICLGEKISLFTTRSNERNMRVAISCGAHLIGVDIIEPIYFLFQSDIFFDIRLMTVGPQKRVMPQAPAEVHLSF